MRKGYKIKRYNRIYRRRPGGLTPVKIVLLVLAAALSALLVFSLYGPVHDFLSGRLSSTIGASGGEEAASPSSGEEASPPPAAPAPAAPAAQESDPPPVTGLRACYIPASRLLAGEALSFVEGTGVEGYNAVMIDLKDTGGSVLYRSNLELVAQAGAQSENAVDLGALCAAGPEAGYQVIGRVQAFCDPLAPKGQEMAAVKYMNSDWGWLDAEAERGGKPWLNPYSPIAQSYITDIALEAIGAGVDTILLDSVQFPEGYGLQYATYGEWSQSKPKDAVLREFVQSVREQAAQRGGSLLCYTSADSVFGQNNARYGESNPANLFGGALAVGVMPASFGEVSELEGFRLQAPATTPFDTVQAVLGRVKSSAPSVQTLVACLQGYTDNTLEGAYNRQYTAADVAEQIRAAGEAGIDSYIVLY